MKKHRSHILQSSTLPHEEWQEGRAVLEASSNAWQHVLSKDSKLFAPLVLRYSIALIPSNAHPTFHPYFTMMLEEGKKNHNF